MHLRRDLLDDAFDVEEIDRPFRIAPERSDRAVEDDGDAVVLADLVVACRGGTCVQLRTVRRRAFRTSD